MEFGGPNSNLEARPIYYQASKSPFVHGKRRKLNCIAICMNVFLPWMVFMAVYMIMSFKMHYRFPHFTYGVIGGIALLSLGIGGGLIWSSKDEYTPYWYKFTTMQFLIAILVGSFVGYYNHFYHMMPYYDWERLKVYPHVDVSKEMGQNLMDAGTVYFAEGTGLDLGLTWHFKTDKVYNGVHRFCVAPIIKGGAPSTGSYDFWAVGMDCCAASSSDYRCGDFGNGVARSALRLLADWERPYYKLAVQQAEAQYGYKAKHPLFFEWLQDPLEKVQHFADLGNTWYLVGIVAFFAYNLTAVSCATFRFAFIGRTGY